MTESERLQSELEPLELVKSAKTEAELLAEMKATMEPQDFARFEEISALRVQLESRCERIMQNTEMSHRVKKARLNLTRKEMAGLLAELGAMVDKYEKIEKKP